MTRYELIPATDMATRFIVGSKSCKHVHRTINSWSFFSLSLSRYLSCRPAVALSHFVGLRLSKVAAGWRACEADEALHIENVTWTNIEHKWIKATGNYFRFPTNRDGAKMIINESNERKTLFFLFVLKILRGFLTNWRVQFANSVGLLISGLPENSSASFRISLRFSWKRTVPRKSEWCTWCLREQDCVAHSLGLPVGKWLGLKPMCTHLAI